MIEERREVAVVGGWVGGDSLGFHSRRENHQETTSGWTFIFVSLHSKSVSNMFPGTLCAGDFLNQLLFFLSVFSVPLTPQRFWITLSL